MIEVDDDSRPRMGRRAWTRWLWAVVPVAVVVVGGVVAVVVLRDPARPVSVEDAVDTYRDRDDVADGDGGAHATGAPPPAGVYVYTTTGSEKVDALGGITHTYPATSTITVTADGDGCLAFRWAPLEQRRDEEVLCPDDDGGWSRVSTTLHHSFLDQDETRVSACDGPGFVPAPDGDGELAWSCESEGSGRSGESLAEGTGRVVGTDTVAVEGVERAALHVRYEDEVTGETAGSGTLDRWYARDRFPLLLREVSSATSSSETVIGTVTYQEDYELVLASWEPQR
ncbi:MAG TPA: hypothetical protein VFZ79_15480 [Acidimicrobiales bacterium]